MTEQMAATEADIQKRRSTRIAQSVPVTVIGVDALGQAFKERTSTVSVNCHGCKYQSKHYVPKGSQVTIEIPHPQSDAPPRTVEATVAWVQRPRTVRELFQIGVQFTVPGNAWGIAFPPADWFPLPDEQEGGIQIPVPPAAAESLASQPLIHEGMPAETPASVIAMESDVEAAGEEAEDNVRVLPVAAQAQETMSMARQMARLVAEAKQHLRRSVQSGAAEAVAQELRTAREQVEVQLRTAVNEAVEDSVTKATEKSVHASVQNAVQSAVRDSLEQLVGQATQQVVQNALAAFEQARQAASPKPEELDTRVRAAVERVVETSAAKLAEQTIQQSVQQSVEQAVKQSVQQAVERATANLPMAQRAATVTAPTEEVLRQLDEAAQARLSNWRKELEDAAGKLREQSRDNLNAESEAATRKWREQFDVALTGASAQMTEQLNQISHAATARAEQEISARSASLQGLLNEAASEAQKNLEALCTGLEQERTRAEAVIDKADEAVRRAEETGARMESMSRATYDEAQRHLDGLLASQTAELDRRVDDVIQKKAGELEKPINDVADGALKRLAEQVEQQLAPHYERARQTGQQIARSSEEAEQKLQRLAQQVEEQLAPQIARAQQTGQELRAANQHAEDALHQFRAQMHEVSEQALTASLERMRQQSAELPAEFEQTCRAALARVEEELDAKSTDTTHSTFEALYKASEWYQKKAQTSMQTTLEKMMDQSTGALRERAAEVSRMFGSELDHYSRSYVEHAQGMIEEDAKEIKQRTREQLEETAKTVAASATDELHRITSESLARFEDAAKISAEQTQAGMKEGADKTLGEFDAHLEERMVQGATLARKHLEEQLKPLVAAFYARREAEQAAWLEQMKGSVEKSIEQYKERLENTSNSWLLASATTLGQHSKSVLQTLSEAAEERLRDTCADVFAGLGDTLRSRLLGLSSEVGTGKKPLEKK
ncbi:MAG: PilZ domain-containing protein [Candidatus Acidiferrales bacterium]